MLRLDNLANLRLDRTLVRTKGIWHVAIPASESKSRRPIEFALATQVGQRIDCWLSVYRPRFRGHESSDAIWLSRNARPLSSSQLYTVVVEQTRLAFGKAINPHLARDCAVTSIALNSGAKFNFAAGVLGHRSARTTQKHYNQARMIDAVRRYQTRVLGEKGQQ